MQIMCSSTIKAEGCHWEMLSALLSAQAEFDEGGHSYTLTVTVKDEDFEREGSAQRVVKVVVPPEVKHDIPDHDFE